MKQIKRGEIYYADLSPIIVGTEDDDANDTKIITEADVSDHSSDVKTKKREDQRANRRQKEKLPPIARAPIQDESDREKK